MRPLTLNEAVDRIQDGTPAETALGEFLDHFYTASASERISSLSQEPSRLREPHLNALVAAIAEHLTKSYSTHSPPQWVEHPSRFMATPWFAAKRPDPALREYLTWSSPAAFKRRNIMTSGSPLRRATTPPSEL
jgi:hypothetical protein